MMNIVSYGAPATVRVGWRKQQLPAAPERKREKKWSNENAKSK